MNFPYVERIGSLTPEQRLHFYEILAHRLTTSMRLWSDPSLSDAQKVELMKWLNEIQHRVVAKISVLRRGHHEWTEEDSWADIQFYIAQCPAIGPTVLDDIEQSYRFVVDDQSAS